MGHMTTWVHSQRILARVGSVTFSMVGTLIRFLFCLSLVLVSASKRQLSGKTEPALKIARTVTRNGVVQPATDALIISDIVPFLLESSEFSLAYPFALVSHEYFKAVCGACFGKLVGLPISPMKPAAKAILTFASQYLRMSGMNVCPEKTADIIFRLINGTDNHHIVMQAIASISRLEFPESKRQSAIFAVQSLQSKMKPGEITNDHASSYLQIKYDGFEAFSNIVDIELWHRIRCAQDDKFCRPDHVNRSKDTFFGNIRVFFPEYFKKKYEEIYMMDNYPIMVQCSIKFLPFYQQIMGGVIMAPWKLPRDLILEKIKANDCNLFWKMSLMQLATIPKWKQINLIDYVWQDPILNEQFTNIADLIMKFSTPADFSVKHLSEAKREYVGICMASQLNFYYEAKVANITIVATKAIYVRDYETSNLFVTMLRSTGHYSAIFDAFDAAIATLGAQNCVLDLVKNFDSRVFIDYLRDSREHNQSPLFLRRLASHLDQIVKGNVMMAEKCNAVLEHIASRSVPSVEKMAQLIIYTALGVTSLQTDENIAIIVEALSKKGSWVKEAYDSLKAKRINNQ